MENKALAASDCIDALRHIPAPNDYGTFWKLAKAAKAAGVDYGSFDAWAKGGQGYNEKSNRRIWETIRLDGRISAGTLFRMAKDNGWQPPEGMTEPQKPEADISGIVRQAGQQDTPDTSPAAEVADRKQADIHIREALKKQSFALPYLKTRGIAEETARRFRLGYNPKNKSLVIPYPDESYWVERNTETAPNGDGWRYNFVKGLAKPVFNKSALRCGKGLVFVTEGQIDAMTIEQAGFAAIGVKEPSILLDELAKGNVTARTFCMLPDDDEAGWKQAGAMADELAKAGYEAMFHELPEGFHDSNDILLHGGAGKLKDWLAEAEDRRRLEDAQALAEYRTITPNGAATAFMAAIASGAELTSTGFKTLDAKLGGGFPVGFVILGALSSMGKTTFCLQMADQMAENGHDVLYMALEQGRLELMAKSISRMIYQRYQQMKPPWKDSAGMKNYPLEISALDIRTRYKDMEPEKKQAVQWGLETYANRAGRNIYYKEARGADISADDIRLAVAEHKRIMGRSPIVIIDYLQLLSSEMVHDGRGRFVPKARDEREVLNNSIKSLTAISRDFQTIVIGISAFNRNSYRQEAGMDSFNGSSRIEYSADVLMALEPNRLAVINDDKVWEGEGKARHFNVKQFTRLYGADQQDGKGGIMPMALSLLKNRNGLKDASISFDYKPKCDTFTDMDAIIDAMEFMKLGGADA